MLLLQPLISRYRRRERFEGDASSLAVLNNANKGRCYTLTLTSTIEDAHRDDHASLPVFGDIVGDIT